MRGAGEALVGLVGSRLELLGIELREEILYLQRKAEERAERARPEEGR